MEGGKPGRPRAWQTTIQDPISPGSGHGECRGNPSTSHIRYGILECAKPHPQSRKFSVRP
eukprot:1148130-Pelagomonas_calceolata.AAC.3